ncbi:hypothetical protein MEQU1_000751 [Malassezia equina]|uniref:triacylglycerol lipase n=1 Tax=Malassezia equina TaxID=1381935 RepID=A0AAF0IXN7_9BASI|nr:hypothetical protein MEQU1_000751 [Malassezia equina]
MYRTSFLSKDQPTTSVTTILVPYNATTDRLLTLGYFEDANPQKCEPSYTLRAVDAPYAPELNVVGWVFGGTPTHLEDLIRYINKKPESGLIMAGMESMRATYPTFDKVLKQHGISNLSAALEFARTHCQLDVVDRYKNIGIFSKNWTSLGQDLFKNPAVNKAVGAQVLGQPDADYPSVPILMAHGKSDEIVPFDSARETFSNWCSKGLNGEFLSFTYANATHEASEISLTVPAFKWLSKRFNGTDLPFGCSSHTDDEFVKPNTYNATLKDVVETIEDLLGRKVGPDHIIL